MLKALELSGFKSFADKTRFEFPEGITVIVGPNGSGKSNIVDAIKWVLGEQSAKSLRGKEMSDVIFKGSTGSGARRPANAAQATLVLDNANRQFHFDADEVHISRRVYRSGETEYLINNETSRLKDIRELIRGTGVGTDAYSLIEQGKVERMLSTSPKERRAIFEEAAGISRFKAKKVDAERRLARVQGNLIRLSDIVEEVGSRYRSVKAQASRAARYREFSDRLQQLRTFTGVRDWQTFSEELGSIQSELDTQTAASKTHSDFIDEETKKTVAFETQLNELNSTIEEAQERSAAVREQIAQNDSQLQINQSRLADIDQRKQELKAQNDEAAKRTGELQKRIAKTEKQYETAEVEYRDASDLLKSLETENESVNLSLTGFRESNVTRRTEFSALTALVSEIGKLVSASDSKLTAAKRDSERLTTAVSRLQKDLTAQTEHQQELLQKQQQLKQDAERTDGRLAEARKSFEQYKSELAGKNDRLSEFKNQQSGLTQRAKVIEELEKSFEGVNAGARQLLQQGSRVRKPWAEDVLGLVADLISVNVQHAAIVDVALGEVAQHVVLDGRALVDELGAGKIKLEGRVGLIQLASPPNLGADPKVDLSGRKGIVGRASELVQVDPRFDSLAHQLLGGTWVCKTLADAIELFNEVNKSVRYVTVDGEIVESDGTILAGPKSVTSGLVSRRSELRSIKNQLQELAKEIETCQGQVKELIELESTAENQVQKLIEENTELASGLRAESEKADQLQGRIGSISDELEAAQSELQQSSRQAEALSESLFSEKEKLSVNELAISQLVGLIETDEQQEKQAQTKRDKLEREVTRAKVNFARSEQKLETAQNQLAEMKESLEQQQQSEQLVASRITDDASARETAAAAITAATDSIGKLKHSKDEVVDKLEKLNRERLEIDGQRREIATAINERRNLLKLSEDKVNQGKIRIEQIGMQRSQLLERMQEDYDIDLESFDSFEMLEEDFDEQQEREQVDTEIAELRKKLGKIGSVNLEALSELEELEARYNHLNGQYEDLVEAKETLEKIIIRINADSRKIFVETLETIRQNFQKLFRQTFGGGQADIVLEADVDPLEAGVEIIATPPGKPQFNNSLLSGGEKALTAVSLLMAIFQFRPSPFCVLDEVDAPFDEANIGRFLDVLKSFLGWTRFVIVTHSKKTMTSATTLYGITMQESGVSKRVSVRFEDVSEDGEISAEAIRRNDGDAA